MISLTFIDFTSLKIKSSAMKTTLFCLMIFVSACTTIQYHDPIVIPQSEVESLKVTNVHGNVYNAAAGQIKDCSYKDLFSDKNCAQIICKRDDKQPTGLNCLYYIPKNHDTNIYKNPTNKFINYELNTKWDKEISTIENDLKNDQLKSLNTLCLNSKVTCYLDLKYYPENKMSEIGFDQQVKYKKQLKVKSKKKTYQVEFSFFEN